MIEIFVRRLCLGGLYGAAGSAALLVGCGGGVQAAASVTPSETARTSDSSARVREAHGEATIGRLVAKDFAGARRWFGPTMQERMSADQLSELWLQLESQTGEYKERATTQSLVVGGYPAIEYGMMFERMQLIARVVFDEDGEVVGLFFRPAQR
jgi:hypothetical protein